jgi:hypothetical protein
MDSPQKTERPHLNRGIPQKIQDRMWKRVGKNGSQTSQEEECLITRLRREAHWRFQKLQFSTTAQTCKTSINQSLGHPCTKLWSCHTKERINLDKLGDPLPQVFFYCLQGVQKQRHLCLTTGQTVPWVWPSLPLTQVCCFMLIPLYLLLQLC